ncbi:hypothetical protein HD600_000028 [Microbacterium ginsengiterrae]|uniref:Uncharacterized protein n=1 Tax=Microbacterium ginsengiterrae TaxID=546115 RepID=A0A7W9C9W4_9MICO|nr:MULTISPECIES: hypothetical protein [Microbacterium]MBB5741531.1 hypothetical protein [Microbacterium ginsengiterrae]
MTMSAFSEQGGHLLPPVLSGSDSPAPRNPPRRRRIGLVVGILSVAVVGAVCAGVQWNANLGYDDALVAFDEAVADAATSQVALEQGLSLLPEVMDPAALVQDADTGNLMDAGAREALDAAVAELSYAETDATALTSSLLLHAGEKPDWAWELFSQTSRLNEDRITVEERRDDLDSASAALASATDAVSEAGLAAVQVAADAAEGFEDAHVSARNRDILSLRAAAEWLDGAEVLDSNTADAYRDLEAAAVAMLASEQAELAEKEGPLYQARLEIEAFARGLAPDVLLDFDWSPIVIGYGQGESMAGLASWWYGDPGYANIELTNSVAEFWPSDRSRALVAHEVGHAISIKCVGMYDDTDTNTIEAWATAWAISMGYTDDANGTSAYGPPPQELIDTAAGCR